MNIIIFNKNDDLLAKFYKDKNIILSNTKINLFEKKIDYTTKKSKNSDWLFIEFESQDFKEMIENAFNYISYNYKNKNIDGESVIIVFIKKENNEELELLSYLENESNLKRPKLLFISNDKNIEFYSKYIIEKELDYDERDIEIMKEEEIENHLDSKLIDYYKYYNQIGDDEIIFPKIDANNIEINVNFTVNFFVVGKPGSGKSSLINLLLNEKRAKESTGKNTTDKIIKFIKKNTSLAFYDTPGFISGNDVDDTIKLLKEKVQEMDLCKEKIHGILYVLNSSLVRTIDDNEILFIKFLLGYNIPIFFILNFSNPQKKKSQIFLKRFLEEINTVFSDNKYINNIFQVNLKRDYDGNEVFGIGKLMKGIYDYYFPYKINLNSFNTIKSKEEKIKEEEIMKIISSSIFFDNIKRKKDFLEKSKEKSNLIIRSYTFISTYIGIICNIPFSNLAILTANEISLIYCILAIYGIKSNTSEIKTFIKESTTLVKGDTSISIKGYFLGNILKIIPIFGQISGGIISGISINRIGKYTIDYCEKLFEKNFIDYILSAIDSINMGIDELLNISNKFKN
jgi:GTPase Era involved in 16S rRNA processing/uncharacterized protein (DUF697 family)